MGSPDESASPPHATALPRPPAHHHPIAPAALAVAALTGLLSCSRLGAGVSTPEERASGEVVVEGWRRPWSLRVEHCQPLRINGQPAIRLFGREESDTAAHLDVAEGPAHEAQVFVGPGEGTVPNEILPASQCDRFEVEVRETGHAINDSDLVRGHARIDCTGTYGGYRIRATATFDQCR